MTDPQRIETAKHVVDAVSLGTAVGALIDKLPAIASGLSIIWMAIRIYETATVQRWIVRVRACAAVFRSRNPGERP